VTEEMQRHYSTVGMDEKRAAVAGVLRLVPPERKPGGNAGGAAVGAPSFPPKGRTEAVENSGLSSRNDVNSDRRSLPPRCVSCRLSGRAGGSSGGSEKLAAGFGPSIKLADASPFASLRRAGYRIRTGDLQLGKARRHPISTQLARRSSYVAVPWCPKALRVVALKVGFEVGVL
jgi:hypothetical protein